MSVKEIAPDQVPAFGIVKQIIASIDRNASAVVTGHEFDRDEYVLKLEGRGRIGRAVLQHELLNDIRDDKGMLGCTYTLGLQEKLTSVLREAIDKMA